MIIPSDTASDGLVRHSGANWVPRELPRGSAILCRNTAPLVTTAFRLLRGGVPCNILGKNIGTGLEKLTLSLSANSVPDLIDKLDNYERAQRSKLLAKHKFTSVDALADRCECLRIIARAVTTIDDLIKKIGELFSAAPTNAITLATIHKAKGLEWNHVFLLNRELIPSQHATSDWQLRQENNLLYVAVTRARETLTYINI